MKKEELLEKLREMRAIYEAISEEVAEYLGEEEDWFEEVSRLKLPKLDGEPTRSMKVWIETDTTIEGLRLGGAIGSYFYVIVGSWADPHIELRDFQIAGPHQWKPEIGGIVGVGRGSVSLSDGRLVGLSDTALKIVGPRHQTVRRVFFGGILSSNPMVRITNMSGSVDFEECLFMAGQSRWLSIDNSEGSIRLRRCIVHCDDESDGLIWLGGNASLDMEDCYLPVSKAKKVFKGPRDPSKIRWKNVRDTYTKEPINIEEVL